MCCSTVRQQRAQCGSFFVARLSVGEGGVKAYAVRHASFHTGSDNGVVFPRQAALGGCVLITG